jgi:alkanesulfonate monooxygenase SsuD/methylene tetrahydromethanopterin reductase-like flavin-dependent oxidoreductase (luciferase family)
MTTVTPPGRLVRLGLMLDACRPPQLLQQIARMGERARLDAIWTRDAPPAATEAYRPYDAWTVLVLASTVVGRIRLGAVLDATLRDPEQVAVMARTLAVTTTGGVQVSLAHEAGGGLDHYAARIRDALKTHQVGAGPQAPPDAPIRVGVEVKTGDDVAAAVSLADDLVIPAWAVDDVDDLITAVRAGAQSAGRNLDTFGIAVEIPVSPGRTATEARARAELDAGFRAFGGTDRARIVGTLEQCQDRVIELAHAGVSELRCILPGTEDVHDVIAQLTAIAVGNRLALIPGAPRSKAPAPPKDWGGRPRR